MTPFGWDEIFYEREIVVRPSCCPLYLRTHSAALAYRESVGYLLGPPNTASKNLLETSKALVNPITALMVPVIFFLREDMTQKFAENQSNQSLHANILGAVLASENP
ncbi:MAG: hypothetical protein IKH52_03520 [Bacteroidaceae bacterium]|nr:hypothetical protein [Bacteroidaceae bacterium]